jgi:hypothetical protein
MILENCQIFFLNKWNQQEIYSEILMVDFHVICQIMNYPLKLMRIFLKTLRLFMAYYDQT